MPAPSIMTVSLWKNTLRHGKNNDQHYNEAGYPIFSWGWLTGDNILQAGAAFQDYNYNIQITIPGGKKEWRGRITHHDSGDGGGPFYFAVSTYKNLQHDDATDSIESLTDMTVTLTAPHQPPVSATPQQVTLVAIP